MKISSDVIIIGGGLSGLAAAVELATGGARVALFEQSPKLGGRCYSYIDQKTGDVVDNGQHVLIGAYRHTLKYLDMIGTRAFLKQQPALSLPLHHPEKGFASFDISAFPKPLHLTAGMLKFKLLSLSDRRKLLNVGLALKRWDAALRKKLSPLTVDEWLRSLQQSDEALKCLWHPLSISIMNELPAKASALLFARSLHMAFAGRKSDSAVLIPAVGQTELYVDNAVKLLATKQATICTNTEIISLRMEKNTVVGIMTKDGTTHFAQSVISAVPYHALRKILPREVKAESPFDRLDLIASSPIVSINLWFDREFMEMEYVGLIGKNIQWLFNRYRLLDVSNRKGSYLTGVISGAYSCIDRTKEELVALALNDLREVFPSCRNAQLVHAVVIKEKRATFSPIPSIEQLRPTAKTSLRNFYLAGDWTDTGLPATIEGAVMSGFTAAQLATVR